jgi:hypothetical protein
MGKNKNLNVGVDGTSRALGILTCVARAIFEEQQDFIANQVVTIKMAHVSPVVCKFYDCTPARLGFGRLQPQLMPHARYPLRVNDKWVSLPLDQYLQKCQRFSVLRFGVLELLAQGLTCHYTSPSGEFSGFRAFCRPRILQSGNASCLFTATETEVPEFSKAGLRSLSEDCPFAIVNEQPDAASSNTRKKAKSSQDTPANVFHVNGVCDAHQGHRMIEMKEKDLIGNVHAIAVSAANPELQNKLQAALKAIIDRELIFVRGEPDPRCARRNALVVKHTLSRRRDCVASRPSEVSASDRDDIGELSTNQFLQFWNGDWTRPVIEHVCGGCCSGLEEAKANMFSSAIGVDLLQSRDCDVPSMDDWGTCGAATGRASCGILCHDLLLRVFVDALPDWNAMLPGGAGDDEDQDRKRLRIQKKAWRARCVLGDKDKRIKIVLMCWLGAPVENLMSTLQYLDEAGKGLYDTMMENDLNPYYVCRRELSKLVDSGVGGDLEPVFDAVVVAEHPALACQVRAIGLDLGAQASVPSQLPTTQQGFHGHAMHLPSPFRQKPFDVSALRRRCAWKPSRV